MPTREVVTVAAWLALVVVVVIAAIIVDRRQPEWLLAGRRRAARLSRLQQTLLWALAGGIMATVYLVVYRTTISATHTPAVLLVDIPASAVVLGLLSLFWTREPEKN